MDKIKMLIIDDDMDLGMSIENAIKKETDFELVGIATNGAEGIEMIQDFRPQIILLDIIMPIKDGYGVLDFLNNFHKDDYKVKVIVLSSMANKYNINKCNSLGAIHFLAKPFEIDALLSSIKDISDWDNMGIKSPLKYDIANQKNLNQIICNTLDKFGFTSNLKGYTYVRDIIFEKASQPTKIYSLSKDLYAMLSVKYNDNNYCIERAIRTIIQKGWKKNKFNDSKLFETLQHCPSNSHFLSIVTKYVINMQ